MKPTLRDRLNIHKAARFAVVTNSIQVMAVLSVLVYMVWVSRTADRNVEIAILVATLLIVVWGAVLDIREARGAVRLLEQAQMVEEAYSQLEALNGTLRKERHDFKNHLQVIYSLLELEDPAEALKYIDSLYADLRHTGSALKTALPSVNALIAAKKQECADHGITLETDITAPWQGMPIAGWEMCRVLGNLIDNARDALLEPPGRPSPTIRLSVGETPAAYTFRVENNGPAIPAKLRESIFQLGFTTKSEGHGSGLSIVREILEQFGGSIEVASDDARTAFTGTIPRQSRVDAA